jgi:hypothetical protein
VGDHAAPRLNNAINTAGDDDVSARPKSTVFLAPRGPQKRQSRSWRGKSGAVSINGKVYDPNDSMGKMYFDVLRLMAELQST